MWLLLPKIKYTIFKSKMKCKTGIKISHTKRNETKVEHPIVLFWESKFQNTHVCSDAMAISCHTVCLQWLHSIINQILHPPQPIRRPTEVQEWISARITCKAWSKPSILIQTLIFSSITLITNNTIR
jgi:hypothetical protein